MAEYTAGRGTTALGIIGTVLGSLGVAGNNGMGLNVLGNNNGNCVCHENTIVNRYEAQQQARIAELETEVKLRDANTFTMGEMGKLRDYVDGKFTAVEKELCDQRVYNATVNSTLTCVAGQVAQLMALTKTVIPISSICPTPAVATTTA